ncbi:MAG: xanthine dehydrogenase family protein subunit M [Halobacteriales archaeon]
MYPSPFEYYRANSIEEALDLLEEHADEEVEMIAGGHSLLPTMKSGLASPDVLIDIGHIDEMQGIERGEDATTFGALTNYVDIADSDDAWADCTALAEAAHAVGDVQVRNMGTLGGNLAHSDPASDLPAAAMASNATIHAQGRDGSRTIDADDFFMGMYMTALEEDELLTAVEVPHLGEHDVGAYAKKPSPSSGYAMVGVAAVLETDGETIESASVAANGALDHATRLEPVEDALAGEPLEESTAEMAGEHATDDIDTFMMMDDLQASNEFRAQLLRVYTKRALSTAIERVGATALAAD